MLKLLLDILESSLVGGAIAFLISLKGEILKIKSLRNPDLEITSIRFAKKTWNPEKKMEFQTFFTCKVMNFDLTHN